MRDERLDRFIANVGDTAAMLARAVRSARDGRDGQGISEYTIVDTINAALNVVGLRLVHQRPKANNQERK